MPKLTIAAAARLTGRPRSTLQRAIRAGRLPLDTAHRLDTDDLSRLGYLDGPGALQEHAAAALQPRPQLHDILTILRDMQRSMERLEGILTTVQQEIRQWPQERGRSVSRPRTRVQQERSMEPTHQDTPGTPTPAFDPTKFILGRLCPRQHVYEETGQTLWRMPGYHCRQCESELAKERRQAQR